jgi:hypothetical protein
VCVFIRVDLETSKRGCVDLIWALVPKKKREDNIKMDLQEVGGGCGDWIDRAQDRDRWRALVSRVMNFRVP